MYVRLADFDADAQAIIDGAKDFVSRIDFAEWIPDGEMELAAAVERILKLDGVEVALAVDQNAVVGGLGIIYAPYLWNPKMTIAEELFFWAARTAPSTTALRLLRYVGRRIVERDARIVAFKTLSTSPAKLAQIYCADGLRHAESTYMGEA